MSYGGRGGGEEVKNELTEYKQLYDSDSSRGPKDTILCPIDSGPFVSL